MSISGKLAKKAASSGAIDKQDVAIYAYSYQMLLMTVLLWASAFTIGLIFRQLWGMLLFMLCFVPLREYAGGIHIQSRLLCYVSTVFVFIIVAGTVYVPFILGLRNVLLALLPISCTALLILAPQEDDNKPASANEHRHFKRMTRIILAVEIVLIIAMVVFASSPETSYFTLCGLHLCAALVTIKAIQRKCRK